MITGTVVWMLLFGAGMQRCNPTIVDNSSQYEKCVQECEKKESFLDRFFNTDVKHKCKLIEK